mmetsp:Transcript_25239/g.34728  ORF Transcript_25239/g.34728 Transcript_25239/m.34728 type:complete len:203 (-) Transcript_25239:570-1178(-)
MQPSISSRLSRTALRWTSRSPRPHLPLKLPPHSLPDWYWMPWVMGVPLASRFEDPLSRTESALWWVRVPAASTPPTTPTLTSSTPTRRSPRRPSRSCSTSGRRSLQAAAPKTGPRTCSPTWTPAASDPAWRRSWTTTGSCCRATKACPSSSWTSSECSTACSPPTGPVRSSPLSRASCKWAIPPASSRRCLSVASAASLATC